MAERFFRWLLFLLNPRLRAMLSEIAGLNPKRPQAVADYVNERVEDWREIAMEVLYGKHWRER